jgi:hypothetical protein
MTVSGLAIGLVRYVQGCYVHEGFTKGKKKERVGPESGLFVWGCYGFVAEVLRNCRCSMK